MKKGPIEVNAEDMKPLIPVEKRQELELYRDFLSCLGVLLAEVLNIPDEVVEDILVEGDMEGVALYP